MQASPEEAISTAGDVPLENGASFETALFSDGKKLSEVSIQNAVKSVSWRCVVVPHG